MFPEDILQSLGIEQRIIGYLVDNVCQVREEVALVLVREDSGYTSIVELDVFVVDADEVDAGVLRYERDKCVGDDLGYWTLGSC